MKAEIKDRDLGKARGVNIELPEGVTFTSWFGAHGRINGLRLEPMSRSEIRALGQALLNAASTHAEECGHNPDN